MYTVRIFMKCMHVCAAQTSYLLFTKLYIKPDFPSLADEIAEPHPDMNIKVAAYKNFFISFAHCPRVPDLVPEK